MGRLGIEAQENKVATDEISMVPIQTLSDIAFEPVLKPLVL